MPNNHPPKPNNRHYSQGVYKCINTDKYLGDLERIYYRSSWEKKLYYYLDINPRVLRWSVEGLSIPYEITENENLSTHVYYPDAYCEIKKNDGNTQIIVLEIKPWNEYRNFEPPKEPKTKTQKSLKNYEYALRTFQKNIIKWTAAKKFCDRKGIEFFILTEKFFDDPDNPKIKLF
jgi:hypothetical protein